MDSDNNGFTGGLGEGDFSETLGLKVPSECSGKGLNGKEEESGRVGDIKELHVETYQGLRILARGIRSRFRCMCVLFVCFNRSALKTCFFMPIGKTD